MQCNGYTKNFHHRKKQGANVEGKLMSTKKQKKFKSWFFSNVKQFLSIFMELSKDFFFWTVLRQWRNFVLSVEGLYVEVHHLIFFSIFFLDRFHFNYFSFFHKENSLWSQSLRSIIEFAWKNFWAIHSDYQ